MTGVTGSLLLLEDTGSNSAYTLKSIAMGSEAAGASRKHLKELLQMDMIGAEGRKPYFQGQVDVFCAIYAVINAITLTHGIRPETARSILHESILDMARDPVLFKEQLNQSVEYHDVVDRTLNREISRFDLLVRDPFGPVPYMPTDEVWELLRRWLGRSRRSAVLRFVRPLALPGEPTIRHWTTVRAVEDDTLLLFDCSLEKNAIHEIRKELCVPCLEGVAPGLVYVDPGSIRLLGKAD